MNENATVLVKSLRQGDGVHIYVVAASKDSKQAERLRNAVRKHVFDGPFRANVPKRIRTSDPSRRVAAPAMQWGGEERSSSLGFFTNVAEDAVKRYASRVMKDSTDLSYWVSAQVAQPWRSTSKARQRIAGISEL